MFTGNKMKPVAVKTLVEFAAKFGSLDRKFTPSPTGQEGIEGHKRVTGNRSGNYQTEVALSIDYGGIIFRGRADGYSSTDHCIEEIKTFYGKVENIPENHRELHWAQARCYGWMLCAKMQCDEITIALIYFHLEEQKEYRLEQHWTAIDLKNYGEKLAEKYCQWQAKINQRLLRLEPWITQLKFPYGTMHLSQRIMAEAVYKSAATARVVLAEAPTGTGKTLAGLFPAIKAMLRTDVEKIFYLTAKTTGKQLALENIKLIATDDPTTPLRTLELTAQEKSCLSPDKFCTGSSCLYAFNFYTKLEKARIAAYSHPILDKKTLTNLANEFEICPFYLSMEMCRWVDIVVADINYYFDGSPLLFGLTRELNWKSYLLVDECHNLIERGRQMYSAHLDRKELLNSRKVAPIAVRKSLQQVNRHWLAIIKTLPVNENKLTLVPFFPEHFNLALTEFINNYIELIQHNSEHPVQHTCVQEFFFAALNFQKIFEIVNDDFCIDMQYPGSGKEIFTLRNLLPAKPLSERLKYAHGACFFSATLRPAHYYQTLLGLPDDTIQINVPSPFRSQQLEVKIARNVSTRFKDRSASLDVICDIIAEQINRVKGNALVFLSSYEFLKQLEDKLQVLFRDSNTTLLIQSRRMSENDRDVFIDQFSHHNNLLGLAVLGGAFSEGIDLSGDSLKGVFIATLGLPQVNVVNEHMRSVMQVRFQQGYDFTYLYPGIQKVIQAAGRVIRSKTDTGYLWLLDDRFQHIEVKKLLPDWWDTKIC